MALAPYLDGWLDGRTKLLPGLKIINDLQQITTVLQRSTALTVQKPGTFLLALLVSIIFKFVASKIFVSPQETGDISLGARLGLCAVCFRVL